MRTVTAMCSWLLTLMIVLVWTIIVTSVFLCTAWFDPVRYCTGKWCRRGRILLVALNPFVRVRTCGHPFTKNRPYLVIANHESVVDILALSHLPLEMKWLSKSSAFRIPFLGWMMRMGGDVAITRGEPKSTAAALARCRWYLERGVSVMIFPEGTRSTDGELGAFRDGAFQLAIETRCPLLPVVIVGGSETLAKGSLQLRRQSTIDVMVLRSVDVLGLAPDDLPRLKEEVRAGMRLARNRLRDSRYGEKNAESSGEI